MLNFKVFDNSFSDFASLKLCGDNRGLFPDPSDCGYFFDCTTYYAVRLRCAPGTFFNGDTRECDFPENVPRCEKQLYGESKNNYNLDGVIDPNEIIIVNSGKEEGTLKSDIPNETKSTQKETQTNAEGIVITNRAKGVHDPFCYGKTIGNYPDPEFCEYFFQCSVTLSRRQKCAPGTVFNPNSKMCDFPSQVAGCANKPKKNLFVSKLKKYGGLRTVILQPPPPPLPSTTPSYSSKEVITSEDSPIEQFSSTTPKVETETKKPLEQNLSQNKVEPAKVVAKDFQKEKKKPEKKNTIFQERTISLFRTGLRNFLLRDVIRNNGGHRAVVKETTTTTTTTTTQPTSTRKVRSTESLPTVNPTKLPARIQQTKSKDSKPQPYVLTERNVVVSDYMNMDLSNPKQMGVTVFPMSTSLNLESTNVRDIQTSKPNTVDDALEEAGNIVSKASIEKILASAPAPPLDTYSVHVDGNGQARKIPLIETGDINGDFGSDKGILSSVGDTYNGLTKDQSLSASIAAKLKALKYLSSFIKSERLNQIFRDTLRKSQLMSKISKKSRNIFRNSSRTEKTVHYPRLIVVTSMGSGDANRKLLEKFEVGLTSKHQNSIM